MKYGFVLIELIVATLISSLIGALLLTALSQGTRFQQTIDMMVDTSLRVGIVANQLEKDFMGAFIPMQARLKEEKDEDADDSVETKKETTGQKKENASEKNDKSSQQDTKKDAVKKPDEKPLEKIFYGTTKEGHLDILTFITNNPLTVFVGQDVGVVKPKIVRVQYVLKPENEKEKKDTFTLIRQESTELDMAKIASVRSYEVIGGIRECTVSYTARIKKEDEKAKQAQVKPGAGKQVDTQAKKTAEAEKQKVHYEYKVLKEWESEPKEEAAKNTNQEEKDFPRIPFMIEIKMTLWNMQRTKTEDFTFVFQLPIDTSVVKKQEKEKKVAPKDKDSVDEKAPSSKDKMAQANNKADDLMGSLVKTLGNVTKMFNAM